MKRSQGLTWSIRALAVLALVVCVYCKMVDLDCALTDPLHCQTLLESTDNSVSHPALAHCDVPILAVTVLPPVLPPSVSWPPAPPTRVRCPLANGAPVNTDRRPPPGLG